MRARLERAVQAEGQSTAESRFHAHLSQSMHNIVTAVTALSHAPTRECPFLHEYEACDDLEYWTKPELPELVGALCTVEQLVEERVAALGIAATTVSPPTSTIPLNSASSNRSALYATLVRHLIEDLVTPLMNSVAASLTAAPTVKGITQANNEVRLRLAAEATSASSLLFAPTAPVDGDGTASPTAAPVVVLVIPVGVYVGWRCCFRFLDAFGRALGLSATGRGHEDGEGGETLAGWLDVSSAMLEGLQRTSQHLLSFTASTAQTCKSGVSHNGKDNTTRLLLFQQEITAWSRLAHCYWWWWTFTASAAALTPEAHKSEVVQLWCVGRCCATRHLSAVVLPGAVRMLREAMSALILPADAGSCQSIVDASEQHFQQIVVAVGQLLRDVFPHAQHHQRPLSTSSTQFTTQLPPASSGAASTSLGFARLIVHDALRPVAERLLDDPASLMSHAHSSVPSAFPAPPAEAPSPVVDGWDDSDNDDEWEEVQVMNSANVSAALTAEEKTNTTQEVQPAEAERKSGGICSTHDAVVVVLNTLEAQFGSAVVGQDAVVMTLRRLL